MSSSELLFDYLIVGAGSAGCVLAHRLTEDPAVTVCLIEAGPADANPLIHIPAGVARLIDNPKLDWRYQTVPQASLNGRCIKMPRGRVLGGTSSINGMVYFRGHPHDFDEWAAAGNAGWSYRELLPYFIRCESNATFNDPSVHGLDGPMAVSSYGSINPLTRSFLTAAAELGFERREDFNAGETEGFGVRQANIRNGRRESTATGYLKPARARSNLHVLTESLVESIALENRRAAGVAFRHGGQLKHLRARREVLVCAGTFASPTLLMRSGIGPGEVLQTLGVPVLHALPGVGENLQDHIIAPVRMKTENPTSYGLSVRAFPRLIWNVIEYALRREGLLASNLFEATGMVRTSRDLPAPDLQLVFMPAHQNPSGYPVPIGHGFGIMNVLLRPKSRGTVRPSGPMASDAPLIDPNFFADEQDFEPLEQGVALSRRLFSHPAFVGMRAAEFLPGPAVRESRDIRAAIRASAVTVHHPVGTCRMGPDANAVVDAELRVHGIDGLRVIDASVMPNVVRGNTAAGVMAIAEKAADAIRGRHLSPSELHH